MLKRVQPLPTSATGPSAWLLTGILILYFPLALQAASPAAGECPQPRFTQKAPEPIYGTSNPLLAESRHIDAGASLYNETAKPAPCQICHGKRGDGKGQLASQFNPPPRNFACAETVFDVSDGQLFWIIKNGSPGTSMPSFKTLSDDQIWQLVLYIKQLANQ